MEEEKYVAVLYEKIAYDVGKGIFVFKPIELISDCIMDYKTEMLTSKSNKSYLSMEDENLAFSDENYCYGYPLSYEDLNEQFPYCDMDEKFDNYYKSLLDSVIFGVYDKKIKKIKNILAPKDYLVEMDNDQWFFDFELEEIDGQSMVNLPALSIKELLEQMEREEYDTVKNYLSNIEFFQEKFQNGELSITEDEIKETKEEKNNDSSKDLNYYLNQLDSLIGLRNVKEEIRKLIAYLNFVSKTKDILELDNPNLHMLFTGNPGTGKTTVARIVANLLYKIGYLKNNKVAEITPKDLIGEFVGHTAPKTANLIKKYKGGLIFIDEAYVLSSPAQEFSQEALVEIIKEMEKNETVFIFAGYKEEMKNFVKLNPGLVSRTGYYIDYKDYDLDELYEIFKLKLAKTKMKITEGSNVENKILSIIEKSKNQEHFGNGRFIDKLFNKIIMEHSLNTEDVTNKEELIIITENDVYDGIEKDLLYNDEKQPLGFSYQKRLK